jgi:phosphoglycerate dehydrogenase-like enzyme
VGLDVFPTEPAPLASLRHPRAILTPHAAGWHPGLGARVTEGIEAAVRALHAGEAVPWRLDPSRPPGAAPR